VTAELDSHKRRRKQAFMKGFKTARDLTAQVATVVEATDRSLIANAIRAIEPPKGVWRKPEVKS
jgi:hypothetical protein